MNEVIERIDSLKYLGEKKYQLAARLGISRTQMARYYSGKMEPAVEILERISARTGCSLDWLRFGRGSPYPELAASIVGPGEELGRARGVPYSPASPIYKDEWRSLGFKSVRRMTPAAALAIISSHVDALDDWSVEEREQLKWLLSDLHRDPELRRELFEYVDFIKAKLRKKRRVTK